MINTEIDLKIIILGNGGVGKTSFIYRYMNDNFAETISTIGASFVLKKWKSFYLGIWDTAGQERFSRISSYYSRGAQAAILAYDITDRRTFENLTDYVQFLRDAEKGCFIVVIGTKLDLVREDPRRRQVTEEEVRNFAAQYGSPCFETSARDGLNVASVFDTIGYHCFAARLAAEPAGPRSAGTPPLPSSPSYHDTRPQPASATACCVIQ